MNNEENNFNFKDKEIEKITSEITKASKHQLGESFQEAIAREKNKRTTAPSNVTETIPGTTGRLDPLESADDGIKIISESETGTADGISDAATATATATATAQLQEKINPIIVMPTSASASESPSSFTPTMTPAPAAPVAAEPEISQTITPLQTYERDIAEAIRSSSASVASINLAQQKRMQEKNTGARTEKIARKSLTILISLVLIISAVVISALVYFFVINRPAAVIPKAASIITADDVHELNVTALKAPAFTEKILGEIKNSSAAAADGKIVLLNFTELVADTAGVTSKKNITAEKFFEFFALSSPPTLGRALGEKWVFGFQKNEGASGSSVAPFLFLSVASFDNAFEGMHRWEEKMAGNLSSIFFIPETKKETGEVIGNNLGGTASSTLVTSSATSGASTTTSSGTNNATVASSTANEFATNNIFEDKIIRSKDVRVLKNTAGKIILLYSFLDQKNLVITTNERTFGELLDRFFSSQIVR